MASTVSANNGTLPSSNVDEGVTFILDNVNVTPSILKSAADEEVAVDGRAQVRADV